MVDSTKIKCFLKPKGQRFVLVNSETRVQQVKKTFSTFEKASAYAGKNDIEIIPDQLSLF